MIQNKDIQTQWFADEGKTFIRKADGFDMGEEMCLGDTDHIDNYEEVIIKK